MSESQPSEDPRRTPFKASCHCGAITVTAAGKPEKEINECHCSICRRYSAAWAYYKHGEVEFSNKEGKQTSKYLWNRKIIEFHFCPDCGCVMYWWPVEGKFPAGADVVGVNTRMMDPDDVRGLNRRVTYCYENS